MQQNVANHHWQKAKQDENRRLNSKWCDGDADSNSQLQ